MADDQERLFTCAEVSAVIPAVYRPRIRAQLLFNVGVLLRHTTPPYIYMFTFEANLPPKALQKFEEICQILVDFGYHITALEPANGRYHWSAEQPDPQECCG